MQTSSSQAWHRSPAAPCWPERSAASWCSACPATPSPPPRRWNNTPSRPCCGRQGAGRKAAFFPVPPAPLTTGFSKSSKGDRYLRAKAMGGSVTIPGEGSAEAHSSGSLSAMIGCNLSGKAARGQRPGGSGRRSGGALLCILNPNRLLQKNWSSSARRRCWPSAAHTTAARPLCSKSSCPPCVAGAERWASSSTTAMISPPMCPALTASVCGKQGPRAWRSTPAPLSADRGLPPDRAGPAGPVRAPRLRPCAAGRLSNPAAGRRSKSCAGRSRTRRCPSSRWLSWATSRVQTSASRIRRRWPTGSWPRCRRCKEKTTK